MKSLIVDSIGKLLPKDIPTPKFGGKRWRKREAMAFNGRDTEIKDLIQQKNVVKF